MSIPQLAILTHIANLCLKIREIILWGKGLEHQFKKTQQQ